MSTMQKECLHAGARNFTASPMCLQSSARPRRCGRALRRATTAAARGKTEAERKPQPGDSGRKDRRGGLGDLLGPIGLTLGGKVDKQDQQEAEQQASASQNGDREANGSGGATSGATSNGSSNGSGGGRVTDPELGPIALSFAEDQGGRLGSDDGPAHQSGEYQYQSISSMSTEEWRQKFETDGAVDLWVEEEFNSGSRLTGGRDAHRGQAPGSGSGEGPTAGTVPKHTVKIHNGAAGQEVEVEVPEDRYILWEAEEQGLLLPWACRMGCCTSCAVRVLEGHVHQPQALGVSKGLREQGYALMCIAYPRSDAVLEVVEEDEIYDKQFGESFAAQAMNPNDRQSVLRDDYALEIADMDE